MKLYINVSVQKKAAVYNIANINKNYVHPFIY
jgi:hypothetical protein